jgi:hypothetical protein
MTTMKTEDSLQDQIQRLADGDLAFAQRAALLRSIDGEHPENWRNVALALVERDILSEATTAKPQTRAIATLGGWLAAACVALGCFLLGWLARPQGTGNAPIATSAPPAVTAPALDYPVPSSSLVREANAQLAPTGYEASLLTRYVKTHLDGREIVIPVSQVRLHYRGL